MADHRITKVVVQGQQKDEMFYMKIDSSAKCQTVRDMIGQRNASARRPINRIYVIDRDNAQFTLEMDMDLHSFREGGDLFENTIYAELDGVSRKDRPTAAVNSNVATAPATAPVAGAASASIPATADYTDLPLHEGVVCDCCDGPIIGFRYKCTQCRDFDLCMSCEGKMRHREHIIVRMPEPFSGRPCRFNKWFRGAMPSASMDPAAAEKPSSSSKTAEERAKKHHKRHHGHHHRRSHDVASGEGGSATCGNFRTMADETNDSSSQNETESLGAKTLLWESGTFPIDPDTIYRGLNIVAGHLMRLADPTGGINTPRTAANAQTTAGQKGPSKRTTTDDKATTTSSPTETTTTPEKESTPKGDAPQEEQPQQQNNLAPAVVTHDTVNLMDLTLDNSPSAPSIPRPTAAESPMIIEPTTQQQQEPSTPVPRSNSENSFDGNDGEWTVIAKEGPNEEMEASDDHHRPSVSSTPVQTELAYDHLNRLLRTTISEQARITATSTPAAPVPVQHHPVPHINVGIQSMLDMGFSNDGNFLTNLMVSCNGDIRKGLDILLQRL